MFFKFRESSFFVRFVECPYGTLEWMYIRVDVHHDIRVGVHHDIRVDVHQS